MNNIPEGFKLVPADASTALEMGFAYLDAAREAQPDRNWAFSLPGYRAMLAAAPEVPADAQPTGLSQGWNLTRKHDGFVVGHQSQAFPPDAKSIQRAESGGYVWIPFLIDAYPDAGEVAPECFCVEHGLHIELLQKERDTLHALLAETLPSLDLAAGTFKSAKPVRNKVRAALSATQEGKS